MMSALGVGEGFSISGLKKVMAKPRSAMTMLAIAASTLASCVYAYRAPGKYIWTALSVTALDIYLIPKLIKKGQKAWARAALVISLIVSGSLLTGGTTSLSVLLTRAFGSYLREFALSKALWSSFAATAITGYIMPVGISLLNRAYVLINDPSWKDKLISIGKQLEHLPRTAPGLLSSLLDRVALITVFTIPENLSTHLRNFGIDASILPLEFLISLNIFATQSLFESLRGTIEAMYRLASFRTENSRVSIQFLYPHLKSCLERLKPEEHILALELLQNNIHKIAPALTKDQFKALFTPQLIQELTKQAECLKKEFMAVFEINSLVEKMETQLSDIEKNIEGASAEQKENLLTELESINRELTDIKKQLGSFHANRKCWQPFLKLDNSYLSVLPVNMTAANECLRLANLPQNSEKINALNQAALGDEQAKTGLASFTYRIQRLSSKFSQGKQTEEVPSFEFLGGERCGFKCSQKEPDYQDLMQWLKLPELDQDQIQEKLNALDIGTESKLYEHKILPRKGKISKDDIKKNLKHYIMDYDKKDIRTRLYNVLANLKENLKEKQPTLNNISIKISQIVYRLATMGMILVPVLLYPTVAKIGFIAGFAYFVLRRFGVPGINEAENAFSNPEHFSEINTALNLIAGRNFFSLTHAARDNMDTFARASFFGRMRILNSELFVTILIAYAQFISGSRFEGFGAGGLLQGWALSREIVHIV